MNIFYELKTKENLILHFFKYLIKIIKFIKHRFILADKINFIAKFVNIYFKVSYYYFLFI